MGLRETSPTYEVVTTVFASSTTITQLQPDNATGVLQVVRTTPTGLDEILDLRVISDGPVDVFVVAGRLGTSGVVQVYEDVDQFEFGRDGTIDRLAHQMTHPLLREATNLVPRNSGLAVWDLVGQRVMLLEDNLGLNGSSGSDGYPDSINPIPAVQIPSTHLAESFAFDETGTRGFAASARATLEDINVDGMLFDDSDGDDVFDFIDDGRPIDSDLVPSSFLFAPSAGQPSISLAGPVGHTLRLHAASIDGTVGAPLGSAVATSNRLADVPLSRALVEGETVRIVNGTREVPGPFAVVGPARPQIRSVVFSHVRPGATVRLVGQGLSSVTSFQLGGSPVSGAVVDDGTATAFIPLSAPLGVSDLVVQDAGGNSARAPVRVDAQGPIVFDAASDFGSWLTAGFACTDAVLAADPPPSLDSEGCALSDATPVATLTSPTIDTSVLGTGTELEVVLVHRPDFSGGDGGVLQASLDGGATWESLGSSSTDLASISSADCHPLGNPSQCTTESEFHGALGFTRTSPGWRTDTFRLPPTGSVRLRLGATRYADGGRWPIDALMVRRREGPTSRVVTGDPLIVFDETCPSGTGGSVDCVSPVDGANAAVLALVGEPRHRGRPSGAPPPDEASILLPMDLTSVPVASQASLTLRHRYDFRRADLVRNGGAYIDVCCDGGCMRADPVVGYPGVLRMAGDEVPAFTDEGVERVWASEVFDISSAAGQLCEVRLTGRNLRGGRADMGWQVDRLAVEWR